MERFDSENLAHLKGQETREDIPREKAEVMAPVENLYRHDAELYRQYLVSPSDFSPETGIQEKYWEELADFQKEDGNLMDIKELRNLVLNRFKSYLEAGIAPNDLIEIADRMAEVRGELFDFQKAIRSQSMPELDLVTLNVLNVKGFLAHLRANPEAMLIFGPNRTRVGSPVVHSGAEPVDAETFNLSNSAFVIDAKKTIVYREFQARSYEKRYENEDEPTKKIADEIREKG